jgi:L-lysine 2,3-aminomutase
LGEEGCKQEIVINKKKSNMKTSKEKKMYCKPVIEFIELDSEISLVLVSGGDPEDPFSKNSSTPDYFDSNQSKVFIA